jgi:hypothetical protein
MAMARLTAGADEAAHMALDPLVPDGPVAFGSSPLTQGHDLGEEADGLRRGEPHGVEQGERHFGVVALEHDPDELVAAGAGDGFEFGL